MQWFTDSFYNLNQQHLSKQTSTLHEDLHAKGFTSGFINGLIYRGPRVHHFGIKGLPSIYLNGPDYLALGSVARVTGTPLPTSPFQSVGMNNDYTAQSIVALMKENYSSGSYILHMPWIALILAETKKGRL